MGSTDNLFSNFNHPKPYYRRERSSDTKEKNPINLILNEQEDDETQVLKILNKNSTNQNSTVGSFDNNLNNKVSNLENENIENKMFSNKNNDLKQNILFPNSYSTKVIPDNSTNFNNKDKSDSFFNKSFNLTNNNNNNNNNDNNNTVINEIFPYYNTSKYDDKEINSNNSVELYNLTLNKSLNNIDSEKYNNVSDANISVPIQKLQLTRTKKTNIKEINETRQNYSEIKLINFTDHVNGSLNSHNISLVNSDSKENIDFIEANATEIFNIYDNLIENVEFNQTLQTDVVVIPENFTLNSSVQYKNNLNLNPNPTNSSNMYKTRVFNNTEPKITKLDKSLNKSLKTELMNQLNPQLETSKEKSLPSTITNKSETTSKVSRLTRDTKSRQKKSKKLDHAPKMEIDGGGCVDFDPFSDDISSFHEAQLRHLASQLEKGHHRGHKWRRKVNKAETYVTIKVKDINDNAPMFPNSTMYGEVQENGPIGE